MVPFLALTLVLANGAPSTAFAHHYSSSYSPDPGQMQSFQQTCFNTDCQVGWTGGENQAYHDYAAGYMVPNQNCPTDQPHSNDYCSQYWNGYGDEWNRSIQQNFNTNQEQGASVNVKGNNNKVNIEQGQQNTDNGGSGSSGHSFSSSHGQNPKCQAFCVSVN